MTRRRGSFRAESRGRQVLLGFNAEKSNRIVDMRECHILRPELFALVEPLRKLMGDLLGPRGSGRSEEHTSELQSLMRISYAVFCLKKQNYHIVKQILYT